MTEIRLKINTCIECPFCKRSKVYTGDSFEDVEQWVCQKKGKKIVGYLETFDKLPKIPEWCPIKVKK